jgi:hypothetical protein
VSNHWYGSSSNAINIYNPTGYYAHTHGHAYVTANSHYGHVHISNVTNGVQETKLVEEWMAPEDKPSPWFPLA